MVAGWPLVEMTGKQEHIVHHHILITDTVLNLMTLVVLVKGNCSDPKEYSPSSSISPQQASAALASGQDHLKRRESCCNGCGA